MIMCVNTYEAKKLYIEKFGIDKYRFLSINEHII